MLYHKFRSENPVKDLGVSTSSVKLPTPHFNVGLVAAVVIAAWPAAASAQTRALAPARRPALLFKEERKQNEKGDEHPITQDSVANANLELKLYGASAKD